jgi:crotonobetainyl-CoA:carnitine CoA-transferase CaiB-like acyl-CoA transferase
MSPGPLAGLRVLELTTAWAGPMSGRILAWFGAEVIHVESPNRTDNWRSNRDAPQAINCAGRDPGNRPFDRAFAFNSQNANKRSLILDLKIEAARTAFCDLAAASDVVTCNYRPGTLDKLGLGYDELIKRRADIIVVEIPAFGCDGPMAGYAALGPTMEMAAGMASLIGYPDGWPEVTGPSYLDPIGGFHAAAAILTALAHRQRTGKGQYVEVPQVEAAMQFIGAELLAAGETGYDAPRSGNRRPDAAPHDAFPTRGDDKWLAIAVRSDEEWRCLCDVVGDPRLSDKRFDTLAGRKANEAEIATLIAEWTRAREHREAASLLQGNGVAAAPVNSPRDVAECPHLATRGFFTELERPDLGRFRYPGLPIHLSATPGLQRTVSPAFGADNEAILRDILGRSDEEIAAMRTSGAIADTPKPGA